LTELKSKQTFQNLNGLRFIGALSVFIFHSFTLSREIWGDFYQNPAFKVLYQIASRGHFGVGLFFVLSGFLITTLMLRELKETQTIHIKNFLVRRILRIWPVYFTLVLFGFFLFPLLPFGKETVHSFPNFAIFLSNMDEIWVGWKDNLSFLTVTWSVSVEEQFYLLLFLMLGIFPFLRSKRTLLLYFAGIVILDVVFRLLNFNNERAIYYHSFSVMSDLAIGGFLAIWLSSKGEFYILKLSRFQTMGIYLIGIVVLLFSRQIFHGYWVSIERIFHGLFFAFVLVDQMLSKHSWFKADKLPGFYFSGNLTYAFYMFHCVSLYYWAIYFDHHGLTNSIGWFVLYIVVNFATTYAISLLSYYLLEQPFLRMKRYFR